MFGTRYCNFTLDTAHLNNFCCQASFIFLQIKGLLFICSILLLQNVVLSSPRYCHAPTLSLSAVMQYDDERCVSRYYCASELLENRKKERKKMDTNEQ
jgi:hypothetical protein